MSASASTGDHELEVCLTSKPEGTEDSGASRGEKSKLDEKDLEIQRLCQELKTKMALEAQQEAREQRERELAEEEEQRVYERMKWRNYISLDELEHFPLLETSPTFLRRYLVMREKVWRVWTLRPEHHLKREEAIDLLQPEEEGFLCLVHEWLNSEALINNTSRPIHLPPLHMDQALPMIQRPDYDDGILSDAEFARVWDACEDVPVAEDGSVLKNPWKTD